jgi:hypothetical protein
MESSVPSSLPLWQDSCRLCSWLSGISGNRLIQSSFQRKTATTTKQGRISRAGGVMEDKGGKELL